ncbi:MAG: SRPBCC family protein [Actinomycetota bacterium]|nr:SRPBCC family protein [Actinomycetota bacterium]MDA8209728.1 SRPBCC family protein [Actinomycetota bacterium]
MELVNNFSVKVPVDRAWALLTDVQKIAPCLPGATLEEVEGDEYRGSVKVKVGPITAAYKGKARFIEMDESGHSAVLKAEGRDTKGQGNASATVALKLNPDGDTTNVNVTTDLAITGKVASFGRGVLADVSTKLLGQFVDSLEELIASEGKEAEAPAPAAEGAPAAEARPAEPKPFVPKEAEPVDLLGVAGSPIIKRAIPAIAGTVFFLILVFLRRSRKRRARKG